jgi:ribose 5-phosphate isomerase A
MTQDELKALVGRPRWTSCPTARGGRGHRVHRQPLHRRAGRRKDRIAGAVSSSDKSTAAAWRTASAVFDTDRGERLPVYIDGADEIDPRGHMIKGGGAALTREKIVADLAERFVCIADESKRVPCWARFPLPVEVIAMAAAQVTRRFAALGGRPRCAPVC